VSRRARKNSETTTGLHRGVMNAPLLPPDSLPLSSLLLCACHARRRFCFLCRGLRCVCGSPQDWAGEWDNSNASMRCEMMLETGA
jgi:hypothetical protein